MERTAINLFRCKGSANLIYNVPDDDDDDYVMTCNIVLVPTEEE